jgi:hypothetical protein
LVILAAISAMLPPGAAVILPCGREHHAVRVDQEHLAVGVQRALDHGYVRPQHAVQRDGVAARLIERDAVALADGKALPVHGHLAAVLVHRHGVAVLADGARTRHHVAARRQIRRKGRAGQQQGRAQRGGAPGVALAARAGMLGNRDIHPQCVIPDQAVDMVEGGLFHGMFLKRQRHNL